MTANKFNLEADVEKEQPKETADWQQFESAVSEVLGNTQERIEKSGAPRADGAADKIGQTFYDQNGKEIPDIEKFRNGQPVLNAIRGENGQKIIEIYANKNAALSGTPFLRQSFRYDETPDKTVEHREVFSPGHPTTRLESSLDKESMSLTFRVESGNTKQEIVIDADSNPIRFDIADEKKVLSYKFSEGKVVGVDLHTRAGSRSLFGAELDQFASAAEQSLQKLRSANGLPEPLPPNQELTDRTEDTSNKLDNLDEGIDPNLQRNRGFSTVSSIFGGDSIRDSRASRHDLLDQLQVPEGMDPASYAALMEAFPSGSNLNFSKEEGHHGINNGYTRLYFGGDATARKEALRGLEDEVLGGVNHSALQVLKELSLVDAIRQLRTATNREETLAALKALAALETGDKRDSKAKDALEAFPSSKEIIDGHQRELSAAEKQERTQLVQEARQQVYEERVRERFDSGTQVIKAITGTPEERRVALQELEKTSRKDAHTGDPKASEMLRRLAVNDLLLRIKETNDPEVAAQSLRDLDKLRNIYNTKEAGDALGKLPVATAVKELTKGEQTDVALERLKEQLSASIEKATNRKAKSASELLDEFGDKEAVNQAREELTKIAEKNFADADKAFEKLLDRSSSREEILQGLQALKLENERRVRTLKSPAFNELAQNVEAAVAAEGIRDSLRKAYKALSSPDADEKRRAEVAATLKDDLQKAMLLGASNQISNPRLEDLYNTLTKDSSLENLLGDITRGNLSKESIERFNEIVPDGAQVLNEMRLGRILRSIKENSTPEDFAKAAESLQKEIPFNRDAEQWLSWARAGHAVAKINHASNASDITEASAELQKLIGANNEFAKHGLASILISDLRSEDKVKWYQTGNGTIGDKPVFTANTTRISELGKEATDALDQLKLQSAAELQKHFSSGQASQNDRNLASIAALSLAHEYSKESPSAELTKSLDKVIKTALAGVTETQVRDGVLDAVLTRAPGSKDVADLVIGKDTAFLESRLRKISDSAFDGNEGAVRILAAMSNGMMADKIVESRVVGLLEQLGSAEEYRQQTMDAILHANKVHKDHGRLLESLGLVAAKSANPEEIPDAVRETIFEGLKSADDSTKGSASRGILAMSPLWTEKEISAITANMNRHAIVGLNDAAKNLPEDLRRKLAGELTHLAHPSNPASFEQKKNSLQALAAMGEYLSKVQLTTISRFGGPDGLSRAQAAGLSELDAQKLQHEAGLAILAVMARGDKEVRRQALAAFESAKFHEVSDNSELKTVLVAMAKDEPYDLELFEKVNKLVYDTALPRPAAGILKQWDVPAADNNELFEKARTITEKYENFEKNVSGEQMLRRIAVNIELFNSLPPEVRARLFRPGPDENQPGADELRKMMSDPIAPKDVVGQMLNGKLEESRNAFLLRDLASELKVLQNQAAYENLRGQIDLKKVQEDRQQTFDSLVKHTSKGVSFLEKVGYVGALAVESSSLVPLDLGYDPFQDFDKAQSKLVNQLPGLDERIKQLSGITSNAGYLSNLYSFAGDIAKYTDWKNNGMQKEADKLLVSDLWGRNGDLLRQFSPNTYADLFPTSNYETGRGALTRLTDAKIGVLPGIPPLSLGQPDSLEKGVGALRFLNGREPYSIDVVAVRKQAMASIESSAGVTRVGDLSRKMGNDLNEFTELMRAAASGRKYDTLVGEMKLRAERLQSTLNEVTEQDRANLRKDIEEIRKALDEQGDNAIKDKQARIELTEKLKNLQDMEQIFDPNCSTGKQIRDSLKEVASPNFRADTAANWFKSRGPVLLATCVAVGLTVAACCTLGVSSPLAIAAWCSVAGLAAEELTVWGLSRYNANGYTGWGIDGQKNVLQTWQAKSEDEKTLVSFLTEVGGTYGGRILGDTVLALLTMGATKFILSGMSPSSLGWQSLKSLAVGEGKSMAQLAFQSQRAALIADGKSTLSLYMKDFLKNSGREILINTGFTAAQITGETAIHDLSPESWKQVLDESQRTTSFGVGTTLAVLQGLVHSIRLRPGVGGVTRFEATSPKAEAAFINNYMKEGFRVRQVEPGKYHVWPANSRPGSNPFVLQRGIADPPARVFPENYRPAEKSALPPPESQVTGPNGHVWKQSEIGHKAFAEVSNFTESFRNGRFGEAHAIAEGGYPPSHEVRRQPLEANAEALRDTNNLTKFLGDMGHVAEIKKVPADTTSGASHKLVTELPQTIIEIAPGVKVDFLTGKTPGGKTLTAEMQAKFDSFAKGEIGQRLLAEHALIAMEEKVHFHNLEARGQILSPSFAKFARDMSAPGNSLEAAFQGRFQQQYADSSGRAPFTFEQEAILALHDSNPKFWNADMLDRHFGRQHENVRKPVIEWLRQQESGQLAKPHVGAGRPTGSFDGPMLEPRIAGDRLGRNPQFDKHLKALDAQGTRNFTGDIPQADRKPADYAQQDIFRKANEFLSKKEPGKPSLAEEGWAIYQAKKNSPADAAKIDYILVNEQTGQYHILDATAQTKTVTSDIRRRSIIKWEEPTHFDRDSGMLTAKGVDLVEGHIKGLTQLESPLNLADHPPPSFTQHDAASSVKDLTKYRETLANSSNPDVLIFNSELQGSMTFWNKTADKAKPEYKTANEAFQKQADKALADVIGEMFAGKSKADRASSDGRFRTDERGQVTLQAEGNRFEYNTSKAQRIFDEAVSAALGKAKTSAQRDAIYEIKRNGLPDPSALAERVAARLSTRTSDSLLGKPAVAPANKPAATVPKPPAEANRHEFMAAKSFKELGKEYGIKADGNEYHQDVRDLLGENLNELRNAQGKDPKAKEVLDAAQKMLDAYRKDNPEGIRRINELLDSSSEPNNFRLGRNDTKVRDELSQVTKEVAEILDKTNSDAVCFSELEKAVAKQDGRHPEFIREQVNYLREVAERLKAGKLNGAQVDELAIRIAHNLEHPDAASNLDSFMNALIRSPRGAENMKSFERLLQDTPPSGELTPVAGSISYMSRAGWALKMENGAPVTRNGNLVLTHDGSTRVYSKDQSKFSASSQRGTPNKDGIMTISSKGDVALEVEVSPAELLTSMIGADTGGFNTCSASVTAFLKNAGRPEGVANLVATGAIETPRMLQNNSIGKVGDGGANVGYDQLMEFVVTQAKMNPVSVKPLDLGKDTMSAVTPADLSKKGPGIYVATSPFSKTVDGNAMGHTWIITVDSAGKVSMVDAALGKVRNPEGFALQSLDRLSGENADRAARNLGLQPE